jgi:hypothetical protein
MRRIIFLTMLILSAALGAWGQEPANPVRRDGASTGTTAHDFASTPAPRPSGAYGDLPLSFEENCGQADSRVKYLARGRGYTLFLTPKATVLELRHPSPAAEQKPAANTSAVLPDLQRETGQAPEDVVRFELAGASANARMDAVEKLPGVSNYYIGNDPARWRSGIANYRKVVYRDAYPGIDVTYYGNPGLLESDFIVAPGADPRLIEWEVEGAARMRVNAAGDLILETANAAMRLQKPIVYQMVAGERKEVIGKYRIDHNTVHFALGAYDRSRTLIIDPTLSFATYLGGSNGLAGDIAFAVAVDAAGEAYVTGQASSTDFPTKSAFQGNLGSSAVENAFVAKFSADGSALIFSTYLGGSSASDQGAGVALDGSGNAYVVGTAGSSDFPLQNPLSGQSVHSGGDCAFVSSFSGTGSLLFSTYICGGTGDDGLRIVLDSNKNVYVGGNTLSANFPTVNPLQSSLAGSQNTFVAKLAPVTPNGSSMLYSTYFGGNGYDYIQGLALDASNNIYVSGSTNSSVFPTKIPIQANLKATSGEFNSFVAEINAAGTALVYSTYLGGSVDDTNTGLAVDSSGNAYLVGSATSPDFPVKNTLQALDPGGDAYIAKVAAGGGSLDFSTFFGPATPTFNEFFGGTIALDSSNNIYFTGATFSPVLPTRLPLQATNSGFHSGAFITEFKNDGSDYIFSSYLAGSSSPSFQGDRAFGLTLDSNNNIYIVGQTSTLDFPTVSPFQAELKNTSRTNGFVAKIAPATPAGPQLFPASLNFGSVITATPSQPQVVTLANGTTALDITSVVVSGPNAPDFNSFSTCGQTVPPTVVCNFTVTFTPSTTAAESATVTINESSGTQVFNLSGTGEALPPPGTISVNPTSLTFGSEEVGVPTVTASQVFTVTVGTNPVTLSGTGATGADPSDFFQSGGGSTPCSFGTPLPVGTVCQIGVGFDPTAVGSRSATFEVFGTFTGSPAGVAVSGTGTPQIASLTPSFLSFGNQVVNTTSGAMTVTLMNVSSPGGPTLSSISASISGAFTISGTTCPIGAGLAPGQSCTFSIVFSPTSAGAIGGQLTVSDSDPDSPQSVSLTGTGLNAAATLATIFPTSLQFGKQTAGTTSAAQSVFLQNTGNTNLTFTTPLSGANPNAFQATNSCSGVITPGTFCFVSVTFTPPTAPGPFFATLTIQSAATGAPQAVALSGTGIPGSTASLLPNPLVFPATAAGQTSAVEYAFLNNTGPNADNVQSFTIAGADPQDFQLSFSAPAQSCSFGTILNAQAVCVIGVVFTPTQTGLRTATLQVTDTATGTPQTIPLQGGTATGATLTVNVTGPGTVSSSPSGILCPSTCFANFTSGSQVVLTAFANSGPTFASFSSNCIPANPQTTPPTCTLTTTTSPQTVTVTFSSGGGGITITPSTLPAGTIGAAYGQTLQVSGGTAPYHFTISTGTLPAGLNLGATTGTIAGVPTGPAGTSTVTVTVTDSSSPTPLTGSATFAVTIGAADSSNNSELNGSYAFLFHGFNDSDGTMFVVAGSFVADGHGNIGSGFEDADSSTGAQIPQEITTGAYTIGADNRGTMTLTLATGPTTTFAFSVGEIQAGVASKARFIRFDDVSGTNGHTGSGVILKQDPSVFSLAALTGAFAFGESGSNFANGNPVSGVGFVNADGNGNFTSGGLIDLDFGGTLLTDAAISGTYALTSETVSNGRISASLTIAGLPGTVTDILYIISPSQVLYIGTNTTVSTILSGSAHLQVPPTGGFGLGSLSGNSVVALQGKRSDGTAVVGVGTAALDGHGNFTLAFDQSKEGTSTTGTAGGTYTVAGNGRAVLTVTTGTFSSPTAIVYLDAANQGFLAGTDTAASVGIIEPGGTGFSNATLSGNYFLGTIDPTEIQVSDTSGVASFDGVGTVQATTDQSHPGGMLNGDQQLSSPYGVASNGRLTFTGTGGSGNTLVGYVASGCEVELISDNNTNPGLASVECQIIPATLTVIEAGTGTGTVTSSPTGINCPTTCSANFESGSPVVLTATPTGGSTFTGFSTDCTPANPQTNPPTCTVTMTGSQTATVTFTAGANVTANPTSLTFGSQAQGTTSASQPVTITNVGTSTATITSIAASTNFGETNTCPTTLQGGNATGSSCTVNVSFTPTATGALTGTVTVTYTSVGSTAPQTTTITLTGTGTGATGGTITITPTSLGFGAVGLLTTSAAQTVTVSNTGGTAVTFTNIVTSGDFAGATLAQCPSIAVDAEPCTFHITFTPTATGTRTGTITFTDNATGSPQTVTLTGVGVAAVIGIAPTSLEFGSQAVGTTSAAQTVTVSNNGAFPLKFSSIVTSGDFAGATLAQCPSIAEEAPACTFSITFTPTATGTRTGAITFTDNATGSPQTVTLTGPGTPGTATVTVTPSSLAFGSQALTTTSAPLSVTVKNTSSGPVNFAGFTTSGEDAEDFGVPLSNASAGCNPTGTLAAGASCTINVLFTPQAAGTRTATLLIADNATGSPQTVALSGTGVNSSVIITVAPGGSTTATTVSGGTAYYGLMITGAPGVTGTVQLGCVPSSVLITCKVIPGSVTLNGSSVEVAFAIQTFCQGATTSTGFAPPVGGIGGGLRMLLATMMLGLGGLVWTFRRNRRVALTFATLLLVALGSAACNSLPSGPNGATPAGTYSLSLTTTLNGQTQTLNNFLTLVVK